MKLFFKNIIIFTVVFFVIEKASWFLLGFAPSNQNDKRLGELLNGEINKELIVLGSSRGAGNILVGQLEKETGLSSYNLSYQGSNVNFHEFVLKTLLEFNKKPKTILLSIDNPSHFSSDVSIKFRSDVLEPYTKHNYINSTLIDKGINNRLSHFFCLSRLNKSHFRLKKGKVSSINPLDEYGSMPLIKKKNLDLKYNSAISPYSKTKEAMDKINAFKSIQNLCHANDIELIYVFSPNFRPFNHNFYKRFKELIKPNEKVILFDKSKQVYQNPEYFYDYAHLLENGAEIFTSEISAFLKSQ